MAKFLRPNKAGLMNAQHYEFMDVFITVLVEAGFSAAKIAALVSQLQSAFSEEDRWYMVARASEIIALRDPATNKWAKMRADAGVEQPQVVVHYGQSVILNVNKRKLYVKLVNASAEKKFSFDLEPYTMVMLEYEM